MSFAINSSVVTTDDIKSVVTHLLVGCQKKAVLYTWKDGEAQEAKVHRTLRCALFLPAQGARYRNGACRTRRAR